MSPHCRCALSVAVVLLVGTALLAPAPARAQCDYPTHLMSPVFCYDYTGPMVTMTVRACFAQLNFITNTMTMQYRGCTPSPVPTDTSNVAYCGYIMGQRRLFAHRSFGAPTMAHCQVVCDCGALRVDEGDGLPVELMDFGIEDADHGSDDNEDQAE